MLTSRNQKYVQAPISGKLRKQFQGGITEHKAPFAHEHAEINELEDIVKELKQDNDNDDDDESEL